MSYVITDLALLMFALAVIAYVVHGFIGRPRRRTRQRGFEVIMKPLDENEKE
jgi:hypothetical protein